jgi:hypothetical protein
MKILKRILLVIVVLIGLVLVTALFVKKDMKAEREVVINKPKSEVYDYVKYLKNQKEYSKWASMDPAMRVEYKGADATPGFVYAWESKKDDVGKGEQEIKAIKEGERIDYELRFLEPMESTAASYMITEEAPNKQTKVKWGFDGKMNYPFNIMNLFMDMEKMIGDDFSAGLNNLKTKMEKQ